jgi:hypothetical protein
VRQRIDLPAEQFAVKLLRAGGVIRRDFKPDQAGGCFFRFVLLLVVGCCCSVIDTTNGQIHSGQQI